ncbi:GNAT family N-acetyltransferase [Pendulispora albinea]|uniref:GNAT family N-acetyltransferase n=1 Tax=Pendulispora albinea TaxID=2741071 RepID=A0ABZ2LWF6_9BACT
MSTVPIRRATGADLHLLPALEALADTVFDTLGFGALPAPGTVEAFAGARLVLVAGDPPVGLARLEEVDGFAHLEQLSVHPEHHGRGIGGELLEAAFHEAVAVLGYPAMTLCTFADVAWNGPFYVRHGFEPLETLTPGLRRLQEKERAEGLEAMGRRVVMIRRAAGGKAT